MAGSKCSMEMDSLQVGGMDTENTVTLNKGLLNRRLQQVVLGFQGQGYSIARE